MRYEILGIRNAINYQIVEVKNLNTGEVHNCYKKKRYFEGKKSKLVVGQKEHFNIFLVGRVCAKDTKNLSRMYCELIDENYLIGNRNYVQIASGMDIYYIDQKEFEQSGVESDIFYFDMKRKELI